MMKENGSEELGVAVEGWPVQRTAKVAGTWTVKGEWYKVR